MKHDTNANGKNKAIDYPPYAAVGVENLTAMIWKTGDRRSGATYRFNIHRMNPGTGRFSQLFTLENVEHLARLAQLLAFGLAEDGGMDAGVRDDLYCLASCLDDVLGIPASRGPVRRLTEREIQAIETVVEYLWEDEESDQCSNPTANHIFEHLKVLRKWLSSVRETGIAIVNTTQ